MIRFGWIGLVGLAGILACSGSDSNGEGGQSGEGGGGTGGSGAILGNGGTGGVGGTPTACFDMPALAGEVGGTCRGDTFECNGSNVCIAETPITIGGPNDPIIDNPDGEDTELEAAIWPGDYCSLPLTANPGTCTLEDEAACNDECASCAPFFVDANVCLRQCRATIDDNSACRDGYACDILLEVCDTGCVNDADCRVFREDTNDNGEFDPYDPETMTGDRLVYRTDSNSVCNPDTYRCESPGTPGAEAGIPCIDDEECEGNGVCLDEDFFGFPGGYCSKIRCDLEGNECAGDGVCAGLGFGVPTCAESCIVGSGATLGDPSTYLNNTQGCRDGYTCFWGGVLNDATGVCVPGVFNDVTDNNVGEACADSDTCYSPFGQGVCVDDELSCSLLGAPAGTACPAGFGCSVFDCGVPGMPDDVCGDNAECVALPSGLTLCLESCTSAEDCLDNAACFDLDTDPATLDSICFPLCLEDSECRTGQICNDDGECEDAP